MAEPISLSELQARGATPEAQSFEKHLIDGILYRHCTEILAACEKSYAAMVEGCGGSHDAANIGWGIAEVREIIAQWKKDLGQ